MPNPLVAENLCNRNLLCLARPASANHSSISYAWALSLFLSLVPLLTIGSLALSFGVEIVVFSAFDTSYPNQTSG